MISVSKKYKEAMNKNIRGRSYISVSLGLVNQNAQSSAKVTNTDEIYFSNNKLIFDNKYVNEYVTLDENFAKTDGTQLFPPENNDIVQFTDVGFVSLNALQTVRIEFDNVYSIKGLTVNFSSGFPTKFNVVTQENVLEYINDSQEFTTSDVLGDTKYIEIVPLEMIGGQQRLRIQSIQMGIGLHYSNSDVENASYSSDVSLISEELPAINFSLSILDNQNRYDIDDENSFINFLETKQKVNVSYGIELDNGNVEYVNKGTMYLDSWESTKGKMNFKATDIFAFMEDEYELGNKIYNRTAYDEAKSILTDAGFEPDEYQIDEVLRDIYLVNPMPICTHKEALQLLANACRCILYQDSNGLIVIQSNFSNILEPSDIYIESNGETEWSNKSNVLTGSFVEYAEFANNFIKTDGSMYFMPENKAYKETGYVSAYISFEDGTYAITPKLSLEFPTTTQYFGINIVWGGTKPRKISINTYLNGEKTSNLFDITDNITSIEHDFGLCQEFEIEVLESEPYSRVLINQISFGDLTDYKITRNDMVSEPKGFSDKKTKDVYVKLYSFVNEEREVNGEKEIVPKAVDDEVWFKRVVNPVGENQYLENPLIHTQEHAQKVAEWLGNYFANNTEYDVTYRGEPRICAGDLIFYESLSVGNIQTEIMSEKLDFNGAVKGSLTLKKAINMT
jgi:hypothetical protein